MKVSFTKVSPLTGNTHTKEFEMTEEQYHAYQSGQGLIQEIFPHYSASDREFLQTGICDEEWESLFSEYPDLREVR